MRQRIDFEKAGSAEVNGALAGRRQAKREAADGNLTGRTVSQRKAMGEILSSLVNFARKSGASRRPVKLGSVSIKLNGKGNQETLSVRRLVAA